MSAHGMDPDRHVIVGEKQRCHRYLVGIALWERRTRQDRLDCSDRGQEIDCEQEHHRPGVADEGSDGGSDDVAGAVDDDGYAVVAAVAGAVDGSNPTLAGRCRPSQPGR